ncbi:MAG: lytic murein transglycosylase [Pseudomonadota bacterium]
MKALFQAAAWAAVFALFPVTAPAAPAVETSLRPAARPAQEAQAAAADVVSRAARPGVTQVATGDAGFDRWIAQFKRKARRDGISQAVLDAAFAGISYDTQVIRLDRNQSEFSKTIWEYLDSAVSSSRVTNGRAAYRANQTALQAIERRYGVPAHVVVAVWGLETSFGSYRGSSDVIESLATLAYDGRRGAFFEAQLMAALEILQAGDVRARSMRGSWAGAMGHTQFMPTSYLDYAVDFTGDGRRNIWGEDPTDALASTANYLAKKGWVEGQPWGVEVRLPAGFDYALTGRAVSKTPRQWARLGVVDMQGRAVPNHGRASILLPAGAQGIALMIFKNFEVIERYNPADAYVIGVGHLSDRVVGGPAFQGDWPRGDRALRASERRELQERLTRAGFDTQGVDGRIGPKTQAAIRAYQKRTGLLPDGYASLSLLTRLRG